MAMIITVAMIIASRSSQAKLSVTEHFRTHGWKVRRRPAAGPDQPDLLVQKGGHAYVVEVKAHSEGRADRIIPLLSQAILQAQSYARAHVGAYPLAVVCVPEASPSLIEQVRLFAREYAPDSAVGVIGGNGARHFSGEGLEQLNAEPSAIKATSPQSRGRLPHIFSDLNQWMLKVLIAPEVPEPLLAGPRGDYVGASDLAAAAGVSIMSAFRLVEQLRHEGFLDESSGRLKLVRRADLFRRWRAEALRASPQEVSMRFLVGGSTQEQVRHLVSAGNACLALFAAADAMGIGHVQGVPPYIYVPRLSRIELGHWKQLAPVGPGEPPDVILRGAPAPKSVFRGMVQKADLAHADVLQVWLDVSAHPSRGEEQAELIRRKVLSHVIEGVAR